MVFFFRVKSQFSGTTQYPVLQHLLCQISFHYLSSGRLREVKNKTKFQPFSLKGVVVAYERWSLTRGSKFSDLTWKLVTEEKWQLT